MNIFPFFFENDTPAARRLPLAKEIARDPVTGKTLWRGGSPVLVTGLEAVVSWAQAALRTVRCKHPIFSQDFGCEAESLIGRAWSDAVKNAEAPRMVRDALTASPYITGVEDLSVTFCGNRLEISGTLKTIYGEASLHGFDI